MSIEYTLYALLEREFPRFLESIKMIGADRWTLRMFKWSVPSFTSSNCFCIRIASDGCLSCAPLLALSTCVFQHENVIRV